MRTDPLGLALLAIARNAIEKHFGRTTGTVIPPPALASPAATFVTLTQDGELRG